MNLLFMLKLINSVLSIKKQVLFYEDLAKLNR